MTRCPTGRPDLAAVAFSTPDVLSRIVTDVERHFAALPQAADVSLAAALIIGIYTKESAVYKLANAWGVHHDRTPQDMHFVAPFYRLLEGLRSLPPRLHYHGPVVRVVKVDGVPSLEAAYDDYQERFKVDAPVNFFAFGSWSTDIAALKKFMDKGVRIIVFQCPQIANGYRIQELSLVPSEKEVLVPCPSFFTVAEPPMKLYNSNVCFVRLAFDATMTRRMDYLNSPPSPTILIDPLRCFYCDVKYKAMQTVFLPQRIGFCELYGTVTAVPRTPAPDASGGSLSGDSVRKYAADTIASRIFADDTLGGARTALQ